MRAFLVFWGCVATVASVSACGSGNISFGSAGGTGGTQETSSSSTSASSGQSSSSSSSSGNGSGGGPCTTFMNCAQQGFDCGTASDGCGDTLDCGSCPAGQTCGALTPNVCGTACSPLSCAQQGFDCGMASDTCGDTLDCGTCPTGQTCGLTTPNVCGCASQSCLAQGFNCGTATDGCGNSIDCGTCPSGETCGTVTANVCGGPCAAYMSCAQQGFNCGTAADGCGDILDCGTCATGQTCTSGLCTIMPCTSKSCAAQGFNCGTATDTCGNAINCGSCTLPQTCGALSPNVCGCVSKSCAAQGFSCGAATDGCNNVINCGTCATGQTCTANVCGSCTNLCLHQTTCPNGGTTSISGTVYAPNGTDPLAGAIVYVPNAAVAAFTAGVSCESSCSGGLSGSPLVKATTGTNGAFTITNMPVGTSIPLVIQKGRWRRQFVIPTVTACTNTALPTGAMPQIRMPQTHLEGDIPLMAFVTGAADALECMLLKVGIASTEFSDPSGTGRVRFYLGSGSAGAMYSASTPSETTLWGSQTAIDAYDMVYFACQGDDYEKTAAEQQIVVDYANAGGRVFATHYNYVWLYDIAPFSTTATWAVDPNDANTFAADPQTGYVNTGFTRGSSLAQWLLGIGASTTLGQVSVGTLRHDFTGVVAPSLLWLNVDDAMLGNVPLHYTFDTPVGNAPASQCGRVLFSDFHVEDADAAPTTGVTFPAECTTTTTMTPEEKMVEYMMFDLDDCISP